MASEKKTGARIEGGIDAVVVGGSFEALAAAASLAQGGYRTILVEDGAKPLLTDREEIAPGFFCDRQEELIWRLDSRLISELDLYRFGFAFAERRLETVYHVADHAPIIFGGDPLTAHERDETLDAADAEELRTFLTGLIGAGVRFRDVVAAGREARLAELTPMLQQNAVDYIDRHLQHDGLRGAFVAEACLRGGFRPTDPFSALALPFRYSGDVSGLRGALGVHSDGVRGFADSLRRAAQSYGVEFRRTSDVAEIIIEWDCVAGIQFADGGQLRASVVISAHEAERAFLQHIGRSRLDIEFVHGLEAPSAPFGYLQANIAVEDARLLQTMENYSRARHVGIASRLELASAYRAAREGGANDFAMIEVVAMSDFIEGVAPAGGALLAVSYGPVGARLDAEGKAVAETELRKAFCRLMQMEDHGITALVSDVRSGRQTLARAAVTAALLTACNSLEGFFFCGPEATVGGGISGAAGRMAAENAIEHLKRDGGGK